MIKLRTASLIVLALLATGAVKANPQSEIVTWVDDNGVTHFGHPQFAPPQQHEAVRVNPANGMVAPDLAAANQVQPRSASVVTLDRTKLKNKRGFRGYGARSRNTNDRRRRR